MRDVSAKRMRRMTLDYLYKTGETELFKRMMRLVKRGYMETPRPQRSKFTIYKTTTK